MQNVILIECLTQIIREFVEPEWRFWGLFVHVCKRVFLD